MKNNEDNRVERMLGSLDGLHKASAPDFFYTRLLGRLQKDTAGPRDYSRLRPAFITASLVIVLVVNQISLNRLNKQPIVQESAKTEKPATIETFAEAYGLNSTTVYE